MLWFPRSTPNMPVTYKGHGMQDVIIASDYITGGAVTHWKDRWSSVAPAASRGQSWVAQIIRGLSWYLHTNVHSAIIDWTQEVLQLMRLRKENSATCMVRRRRRDGVLERLRVQSSCLLLGRSPCPCRWCCLILPHNDRTWQSYGPFNSINNRGCIFELNIKLGHPKEERIDTGCSRLPVQHRFAQLSNV